MQRTLPGRFGRALLTMGLLFSLLTVPSLMETSHAANPDCAPTILAPDGYSRAYLFTSTTLCDWTVPSNVTQVDISMIAGGGGGGGGSWSGTHGGGGGGGGAGGIFGITTTLISSSRVSIQVGTGGTAGTGAASQGDSSGVAGGAGSDTIFNDTFTAIGGLGGGQGVGDVGGTGGANGGISLKGTLRTSYFERKSGGGQNNGNGGGGSGYNSGGGETATSTAPGSARGGGGLTPRNNVNIGGAGGGGANQSSTLPFRSSSYGADSLFPAVAGSAQTGSGGGGGHGCGGAASTCVNRNGASGSSGFILVSISVSANLSVGSNYWPTSVGATPTWPTLSTSGSFGTVTWSVTPALPAGISLNTSTGVISGSPTTATRYDGYYFTATDAYGVIANQAGWSLVVNKGSSSGPTFSSANIVYGVPTALSASGGGGTGALTFTTSNTNCVLSGARGETVTAQQSSGTCTIIAQKAGDANWYASSTSATFTMTKQVSTITFSASPSSPKEAGSAITLTATTGAGQTGTVTFSVGGSPITSCGSSGAVTISGTSAVCVWTPTSTGSPFTVGAAYNGDTNYQSVTASTISYTIYPSISLSYPGISTTFGTAKTSTPTISGGTGSTTSWSWSVVKNSDSSTISGITISSSGVVSVSSSVATGTYAMRVNATDTVGVAKSALINIVVGLSSAASPTVTSAESSMTAGGVVHLTASVISAATGTIAFKYGSTTVTGCGTVSLSSGIATCDWTTSTSAGSPFSVTAIYSGDGSYSSATSAAISITVLAPATFTYTSQNRVFGDVATVTPTISGGAGGLNTSRCCLARSAERNIWSH